MAQEAPHHFTARQRHKRLLEFLYRPVLFRELVVRDASDPMRLPHLFEKNRAETFTIKHQHETTEIPVRLKFFVT